MCIYFNWVKLHINKDKQCLGLGDTDAYPEEEERVPGPGPGSL